MLSVQTIQMLLIGAVVGGSTVAGVLFLKKKGVAPEEISEDVKKVTVATNAVIDVAEAIAPNNPAVPVLNIIKEWGPIAAGFAQQLCHAGDISKEERAANAEKVVNAVLKELNIEVNDNRKILIDAAIKDVVNKFGHAEPTEAERQAAMEKLQGQLVQTRQENAQLKQAITQFNATASTLQATSVQVQ